ncbi:hypothetical protein JW998_11115 [candidate division KSB1 bacterium]|nr:hypothetical protein [candidate division KSB1 bacterium]
MAEITLEKTHALLERLAEYVMTELPAIKQDVAVLKHDVAVLKQDVAVLKQDVAGLKQDVSGIKGELAKKADKEDVMRIYLQLSKALDQKADKKDVERLQSQFHLLLEGMDNMAKELDIHRTERVAISKTLDIYNDRLGALEEHNFGTRVRDIDASGGQSGAEE